MRIATAVTALLFLSGIASAEGNYVSFGMGPTSIEDELVTKTGTDAVRVRFAIGHRLGNLAFEAFVARELFDDMGASALGLGIDTRYILPVSRGLQLYVRGSASHLSMTPDGSHGCEDSSSGPNRAPPSTEYAGRGLGGGLGVQLRGSVRAIGLLYPLLFLVPVGPKVNAAVFIDHGYDFYRLHAEGRASLDARVTRLTIGFNVGTDF